jgi:hypothetical protein
MAKTNSIRFAVLFLILAAVSGFAQNATLNCSTLTAGGDDGSGSVTLMTSPQPSFGCCILFNPIPGTPPTSYLSASCDSNLVTLNHALSVTTIQLEARKNVGAFSPFETLVIQTPNGQVRRFPMLWTAGTNDIMRSYQWNVNLTLPQGTTFFIDAYFSTNAASICSPNNTCIASTVWTLQGSI